MDGRETLRRLRAEPATRAIPVMAMSAAAGLAPEQLVKDGFTCFLAKPFRIQQLVHAVESCLAPPAAA
jgi:CheY-like chemotaxis protein